MEIFLWIVTGLLALASLGAGLTKATQSKDKLKKNMAWVEDFDPRLVKTIGVLEILAGIGLIAPALAGVATILVPLAALGLVAMMVGAIVVHARRKESFVPALVLLILAAVVAWGRFGPYAF